jgi:hypothetical protein
MSRGDPTGTPKEISENTISANYLIVLVGAGRFELPTPSPPDWCANQAALRSELFSLQGETLVRRAGPQVVLKVALGTTPVGADGGSPL